MAIRVTKTRGPRRGRNRGSHGAPAALEPGAVEKLLASADQEGSAAVDCEDGGDARRFAAGVIVTRRTDEAGNPIGYLLMSSDIA